MPNSSLIEQVISLSTLVRSQHQKSMINDLKNKRLLNPPKFDLAYGPVSSVSNQTKR
ncbi:Uncharacterised protein [Pseudescherichia vulneris]|nr:Uncharacterised protein [Pseudescherichia vulneris]